MRTELLPKRGLIPSTVLVRPGMEFRESASKYFLFRSRPELPVSTNKKPDRSLMWARTNMSPRLSTNVEENGFETFASAGFQSGTGSIVRMRSDSSSPSRIMSTALDM